MVVVLRASWRWSFRENEAIQFLKSSVKGEIRGAVSLFFSSNVTSQLICFHMYFPWDFSIFTPGVIQSLFQSVERFLLISGELVSIWRKKHPQVPPVSAGGYQAAGTCVLPHQPARLAHAYYAPSSSLSSPLLQKRSLSCSFCPQNNAVVFQPCDISSVSVSSKKTPLFTHCPVILT